MEEVGAVPQRAAVGDVPRGYSQDGNAWDYFSHDQSPIPGLRWGEDGLGGISDDKQRLASPSPSGTSGTLSSKERLFGLTKQRGKPRRGRQGTTSTSTRRRPHVHEVPLQVTRSASSPTGTSSRRTGRGRGRNSNTSSSTGDLRRRPVLRCLPQLREGGPGRHPDPRVGPQPRKGGGPAAGPSHAVVPKHLVLGRRGPQAGPP